MSMMAPCKLRATIIHGTLILIISLCHAHNWVHIKVLTFAHCVYLVLQM